MAESIYPHIVSAPDMVSQIEKGLESLESDKKLEFEVRNGNRVTGKRYTVTVSSNHSNINVKPAGWAAKFRTKFCKFVRSINDSKECEQTRVEITNMALDRIRYPALRQGNKAYFQ